MKIKLEHLPVGTRFMLHGTRFIKDYENCLDYYGYPTKIRIDTIVDADISIRDLCLELYKKHGDNRQALENALDGLKEV